MAALFESGSQGVHEDGDALVTHFPPGTDAAPIEARIRQASAGAQISIGTVPATDWTEAFKQGVRAHRLGRLTIAPPWLAAELDPATSIIIEPAMAFGTGEHPTTRGVVRLMQKVVRQGDRVADLGAGSAVLAIAAAKLGAGSVAAIEMDHDAIENAEENIERNGVSDRVRVIEGDAGILLPLVAPVRVVLANIISSVHAELLPGITPCLEPAGEAILSGILFEEREAMVDLVTRHGWRVVAEDREDAWWSVHIGR
jgi:ribosomal protein L11 methyltransferase